MIIGNPCRFAIESSITEAYSRKSLMALGYFAFHISGQCYGVREDDATLLACSYDSIKSRCNNIGKHCADALMSMSGLDVADDYYSVFYREHTRPLRGGLSVIEWESLVAQRPSGIAMAPDGDSAFDDGSYVLQMDFQDMARVIAFKVGDNSSIDKECVAEVRLPMKEFYDILQSWCNEFYAEWERRVKLE